TLEIPAMPLAKRMICSEARIDMSKANSGRLSADDWKAIVAAKARLDKAQIYIDDSSLTNPIEILSKCRRLKREKGLDLVMIDYLQLMTSGEREESRQ
ncbi:MAG: replicative DNA helicase, partial [Clostridia bacterium]|nr:replicative DNA helicase [Clostridia bacterium]